MRMWAQVGAVAVVTAVLVVASIVTTGSEIDLRLHGVRVPGVVVKTEHVRGGQSLMVELYSGHQVQIETGDLVADGKRVSILYASNLDIGRLADEPLPWLTPLLYTAPTLLLLVMETRLVLRWWRRRNRT